MWRVFRSSSLFRQTTNCTTREKSTHSPSSGTSPWTDADVTAGCATIAAAVLLSQSQSQSQSRSRAPCDAEERPPPSVPPPPPPPVNANFRERRLTTKYVKYKPSSSASATTASAPTVEAGKEGGSGYVGLEIRDVTKDNVMYPAPFGSGAEAEEDAAESSVPYPPFPPGKVGSYSYHGLEPRFLYGMVEVGEEEEEDKEVVKSSSSSSPSLLSNLFGSNAAVAPDSTTAAAAPTLAKKTRRQMVKVLHHKINQDRGHVVRPYGSHDRTALFAVYDGHGAKGELLAEYTMQALNDKLQLHPSYPPYPRDSTTPTPTPTTTPNDNDNSQTIPDNASKEMSTALRETICAIDREIRKTAHLESKCSGSTACVAVLRNDTLWVANVGDSRAVLGRRNERTVEGSSSTSSSNGEGSTSGGEASTGGLCAIDLSKDQNANDPRERDRILAAGGFITFPDDKTLSPRVWLDQRCTMVGLAMSRSIGDHALESVGVMAEPVVETYRVEKGDEFLILASDGVWEFISSEEAVQIIDKCFHRGLGADRACEELVRASKQRWKEKEGDYRDDITAIVVRLDTLWDDEATTGVGAEK